MSNRFVKESTKELFLGSTSVENIFIEEYMVAAPAEYVRIFLYGMMYAQSELPMNNTEISKKLLLQEEDVLKAWSYWEKMGVVKKININKENKFDFGIEFINQRRLLYGKNLNFQSDESNDEYIDIELKELYEKIENITGRLLTGKEPTKILSLVEDFGASPEMIAATYEYCKNTLKKDNISYVEKVVKNWLNEGINSKNDVEKYLEEVDEKYYKHKRVMQFLGFNRNATEAEKKIMNNWFDELNFSLDKVLEACNKTSGIANPNINYINKVLENWSNDRKGKPRSKSKESKSKELISVRDVENYYEKIRTKNEKDAAKIKKEVYSKIPEIEKLDQEIRAISMKLSRIMLSGGKYKSADLKNEISKLNEEKAFLLTEGNYQLDCMDVKYLCKKCRDTGTDDFGQRCSCYTKRFEELKNEKHF